MGVVTRSDSPYYWLNLPREGQRCLREPTRVLVAGGDPEITTRNRELAEATFRRRMMELAQLGVAPLTRTEAVKADLALNGRSLVYIYFIGSKDRIKIGYSMNVKSRLEALQTSHPEPLELLAVAIGNRCFEDILHAEFKEGRTRGEWFKRDTPGLMALVELIKAAPAIPLPMVLDTYRARHGMRWN